MNEEIALITVVIKGNRKECLYAGMENSVGKPTIIQDPVAILKTGVNPCTQTNIVMAKSNRIEIKTGFGHLIEVDAGIQLRVVSLLSKSLLFNWLVKKLPLKACLYYFPSLTVYNL